jgi:hypothetical protein
MRGDLRKNEQLTKEIPGKEVENNEVIVIGGFKPKKVPLLAWRECIKKIWEVGPLLNSFL